MKRFYYLLFFFLAGMVTTIAQQDSLTVTYDAQPLEVQKISTADLSTFKNDSAFDYEIVESNPTWWSNFKIWLGNLVLRFFEWIFGIEGAAGAFAVFLRILPYALLVLLLLLLIRFFMNANSSTAANARSKKAFVGLTEEEHIIKNEDIEVLIQKALNAHNFRLAVRYYYLYILQLMSDEALIDWQLQKTNHDYENEITKPDLKKEFTKITRLYDYIWYGDFDIDKAQYHKAEAVFSSLKKMVKHG